MSRGKDPAFDDWVARARAAKLIDVATDLRWPLDKRPTASERAGPCPFCGGDDGFSISTTKNVWNCRRSSEGGASPIDMVKHALNVEFLEAVEAITRESRPSSARAETEEERKTREERARKRDQENRRREAERAAYEAKKRRRDREAITSILGRSQAILGTHAEAYLAARGIHLQRRFCADLKFVPDVDYWGYEEGAPKDAPAAHIATLPAMVAPIRDVQGTIIGIHMTFLDPREPKKWVAPWEMQLPAKSRRNGAKKVRGEDKGGMIRLGMIGETLAIAEGIETTLSWWQLGAGIENVTLACGVNLGNIAGKSTGSLPHPTLRNKAGRPETYPNGEPDMREPGLILPPGVRRVILLGDGDSDPLTTRGRMMTAGRRFIAGGVQVDHCWALDGMDFNDELRATTRAMEGAAA